MNWDEGHHKAARAPPARARRTAPRALRTASGLELGNSRAHPRNALSLWRKRRKSWRRAARRCFCGRSRQAVPRGDRVRGRPHQLPWHEGHRETILLPSVDPLALIVPFSAHKTEPYRYFNRLIQAMYAEQVLLRTPVGRLDRRLLATLDPLTDREGTDDCE